jgi:hypothetical protein
LYNEYLEIPYSKKHVVFFDNDVKVTDWETTPNSDSVIMRVLPTGSSSSSSDEKDTEKGTATGSGILAAIGIIAAVTFMLIPGFQGVGATIAIGVASTIALGGAAVSIYATGDYFDWWGEDFTDADTTLAPSGFSLDRKQDPSIRGGRNKKAPGSIVPMLYGTHLVVPPFAAKPYVTSENHKQYLHEIFIVGYNNITIDESTIKIGEDVASNYTEVDYEIVQGSDVPSTIYAERVSEQQVNKLVSKLLDEEAFSITRTSSTNTNKLKVDVAFPNGIIRYDKDGDKKSTSVTFSIEYRDANDELASWDHFPGSPYTVTEKTQSTRRYTYEKDLDNLETTSPDYNSLRQYEVRVTRTTDDDRDRTYDKLYFVSMQSYTGVFDDEGNVDTSVIDSSVMPDLTLLYMKIRASDQFNGIVDQVNFVASARMKDFNGTTWDPDTETNNPAAHFYYTLTDPLYNRNPLPETSIDLDSIENWYNYCNTHRSEFNYEFNYYLNKDLSLVEVLKSICRSARASWDIIGGKFTIVIDDVVPNVTQMFTPRNSWDFSATKLFSDKTTLMNVDYVDANTNYTKLTRKVYYDNVTDNSYSKDTTFIGVTNEEQVWDIAQYLLRTERYRPEVFTFSADIESIICTKGDRIVLQHDAALFGLATGRITSLITDATDYLGFYSDELLTFEVGETYQVKIRTATQVTTAIDIDNPAITEDVSTQSVTFTTPIDMGSLDLDEQNLFVFGTSGLTSVDLIVQSITPSDELSATINCVEYSPEIFDVTLTPDAYDPKISLPKNQVGDLGITDIYDPAVVVNDNINLINTLYATKQSIELQRPPSYDVTIAKGIYHRFSGEQNSYFISTDNGYRVHKKDFFDRLSDGVVFYDKPTTDLVVLSEDEIIVTSIEDENILIHYDGVTETELTSVVSNRPIPLSTTELLYVNYSDGMTLYKKSIGTLDNGTKVLDLPIESYCVISDHEIAYCSPTNSSKLYYKDLGVVGNGTAITTSSATDPVYDAVDDSIYFVNIENYIIYRTTTADTSDGDLVFPFAFALTIDEDGNLGYTDIVNGRLQLALANGKKTNLEVIIPAPPADISFTADLSIGSVNLQNVDDELIGIASVGDAVASEYLPLGTTITYIGVNYLEVSNAATNTSSSQLCFLNASADYIGESSLLPGAITETKISDDAISTPKLQANCVSADKLEVNVLDALIANINESITISDTGFSGYNISGEVLAPGDTRVFMDNDEIAIEQCLTIGEPNTPENATWESLVLLTVDDSNTPSFIFRNTESLRRGSDEADIIQNVDFPQFTENTPQELEYFEFTDAVQMPKATIVEDAFSIYDSGYMATDLINQEIGDKISSLANAYLVCYVSGDKVVYTAGGNTYVKSYKDAGIGTLLLAAPIYNATFISNNSIVYTNLSDGNKLYKKSLGDTTAGEALTTVGTNYPCYVGNNTIIYTNTSDGLLYKKSVADALNGEAITTVGGNQVCYIGNDAIVYVKTSNGDLYKKSINDVDNGDVIVVGTCTRPTYIGNSEIVYIDSGNLYKSSVNVVDYQQNLLLSAISVSSNSNMSYVGGSYILYASNSLDLYRKKVYSPEPFDGIALTSTAGYYSTYVGRGFFVYSVGNLYIKSINDTSTGTAITTVTGWYPAYVGRGKIIYVNRDAASPQVYVKSIYDTSTGIACTNLTIGEPSFLTYIGYDEFLYINTNDNHIYKGRVDVTSFSEEVITAQASDMCYVGDGRIIYVNTDDSYCLYIKDLSESGNGSKITDVVSAYPCYIGDNKIVYRANGLMRIKDLGIYGNGVKVNDSTYRDVCYIGNNDVIYTNVDDSNKLYKKSLNYNYTSLWQTKIDW